MQCLICAIVCQVCNSFIINVISFILQEVTEKNLSLSGNSALLNNVGTLKAWGLSEAKGLHVAPSSEPDLK